MKGIVLAGGLGTRLYPTTKAISKQLLNIYNKPMIYYPVSTLMRGGIKDILIISTERDLPLYKNLFEDGAKLGVSISYLSQKNPNGIADAFIIAKDFIKKNNVCLILGDNIFDGVNTELIFEHAIENLNKHNLSTIFGTRINNPERYGVVEFDEMNNPVKIIEKPVNYVSDIAVTGLYFYTNDVVNNVRTLKPSNRGELEITDLNNLYLAQKKLNIELLEANFMWLDTGTYDSLLEAANYIKINEKKFNKLIGSVELIAFKKGYINTSEFNNLIDKLGSNEYSELLKKLQNEV